ncbi:MAG: OadG family protein [Clostridia bacterium]|nr:OadG family protein [Clostridia bacterium]
MGNLPLWLSTTILGFGTVFIGLIALILIVILTSLIINSLSRKKEEPVKSVPAQNEDEIANRQEFVAAVSAAIATVMGKDVSGLRIRSIKKIS